jgi:putative flippase GtrA
VKFGKHFIKFILVGLLNTAFGSAVYATLIYVSLPIWAALLCGNAAGVIFNFFTTGSFVFSDVALTRLPRFLVTYAVCYVINYASIKALVTLHLNAIESQLVMALPMAALSFCLMSKYVFRFQASDRVR